ncbi:MAG: hypothetical protein P8X96_04220 [Desulfobacteraceae bacterium]|jgi:uncharacterized paraquat-inducible protein A
MKDFAHQRCYNHQRREAVVRCPDCQRFFCRECVTEHSDRMLCSQCLAHLSEKERERAGIWARGLLMLMQGGFGFLLLWYAFYLVGLMLLSIPDTFHEGTIWEAAWWNKK